MSLFKREQSFHFEKLVSWHCHVFCLFIVKFLEINLVSMKIKSVVTRGNHGHDITQQSKPISIQN
jgi:hypothetical protein